jgi:hypothetical protein
LHEICYQNTEKQSNQTKGRAQGGDRDFPLIRQKQTARAHRALTPPIA